MCCHIVKDDINQCHIGFLRHCLPNVISMIVHPFRWLMSFYLMMLTPPGDQNFTAFMGRPMQPSLECPIIVTHQVMRNIEKKKNIKYNCVGNESILIIQLTDQSILI